MSAKNRMRTASKGQSSSSPWGRNPNSKIIEPSILSNNRTSSESINLVISKDEELELSDKLTELHHRYFGRPSEILLRPEDVKMGGFSELKKYFRLYDTARSNKKGRKFDELAFYVAVLLGLTKERRA